jgi:hypothetical protein
MMQVHTAALMLGPKDARRLAEVYDRQHQSAEWRGKTTGLEWVAPELRSLATEAEHKNRDGIPPPEMLDHVAPHGHA